MKLNDKNIEVTVIVPFLNEEKYLSQCIESLLAQNLAKDRFELIFVNNNSCDKSVEIVSACDRILLLNQATGNEYTSRNVAAERARGRVLAFTDGDCCADPNWLSTLLEHIDDGSDIVLGKRLFAPDSSYASRFVRDYENSKIEYLIQHQSFERCFAYTNNMAIKREVFDRLKGFREEIPLADTDFALRYIQSESSPRLIYSKKMIIQHQEIKGWMDWIKKMYSYGMRSPKSEIRLNFSPREQRGLFRFCFDKYRYSLMQRVLFVLSVMAAALAYVVPFLIFGGKTHILTGKTPHKGLRGQSKN
jgi:glycosyltransferase involved in cell wall biosynthesis